MNADKFPSLTDALETTAASLIPDGPARPDAFQSRVQPWMLACFGELIAADTMERNHRFLEEALELVQACGCTPSEAHQLVDYVFGRPTGERSQEVGGVMVTLAALCLAQGLDMHAAGETELGRIWTKVDVIRAKQAAKPKNSPLPGLTVLLQQDAMAKATRPLHRIDRPEGRYEPAMFQDIEEANDRELKLIAKSHGYDLRLKVGEWDGEAADIIENHGSFGDALEAMAPPATDKDGYRLVGAWDCEDGDLVLAYVRPLIRASKTEEQGNG
ncbi:hypothetical protein [Azospirillum doebereinerae]|uniref:hypothetical protein n=1 Tax=Azospirillum doebereinerae TaxID=92933 RepID=UPI001B3B4D98|nr:hypothetical protein [Azospirillum doebereinerae]